VVDKKVEIREIRQKYGIDAPSPAERSGDPAFAFVGAILGCIALIWPVSRIPLILA
jgi:hypothetical protein